MVLFGVYDVVWCCLVCMAQCGRKNVAWKVKRQLEEECSDEMERE